MYGTRKWKLKGTIRSVKIINKSKKRKTKVISIRCVKHGVRSEKLSELEIQRKGRPWGPKRQQQRPSAQCILFRIFLVTETPSEAIPSIVFSFLAYMDESRIHHQS